MQVAEQIDSLLGETIPSLINCKKKDLEKLKLKLEELLCTNADINFAKAYKASH
jgi:hypothetical protein